MDATQMYIGIRYLYMLYIINAVDITNIIIANAYQMHMNMQIYLYVVCCGVSMLVYRAKMRQIYCASHVEFCSNGGAMDNM